MCSTSLTELCCHGSAHWRIVHQTLLCTLPENGKHIVHFGHTITAISQLPGAGAVTATITPQKLSGLPAKDLQVEADLLVAADGSMSQTRARFVPNETRR